MQLFDLEKDPHEFRDVARRPQCAKVVQDLSRRLYAWMLEVDDPILKGPLATPYYQAAMEDFRKSRPDAAGERK